MKQLLNLELFSLLSDSSKEESNDEIRSAYEVFLEHVKILNQSEADYSIVFRSLNLTRIEFQSLQTQILYEQGEKCPKISLFAESYFCY
jgi:hypothetical protein